ncbi:unnamed protein product [Lactuca saligna]|uniref:Uncharacterized protein n=1 Tax=Lactuca saligna TaxID=75948 RepID=A0AA36E6Q5_LACSI|nr:unnamed protein product [Lactuca saligna]
MKKEHQKNLDKANQSVSHSTAMCKEVTAKVEKLIYEAHTFVTTLQTSADSNTSKGNEKIPQQPPKINSHTSDHDEQELKVSNESKDNVASSSRGKGKLLSNKPIVDNNKDEEPDENELKRIKAREAEMDEHQRIIQEAEAKEREEHEA